jgi:hypothetical protein
VVSQQRVRQIRRINRGANRRTHKAKGTGRWLSRSLRQSAVYDKFYRGGVSGHVARQLKKQPRLW